MRILDRYILKRFVAILLFAVMAAILIVIVVDLIGNLDRFIDKSVPFTVIVQYYLFDLPYWIVLILPIAMLLASLFSIGHLARNNELLAITAVGTPLHRILLPLLVFALLVSGGALLFGELVVPPASQSKTEIEAEYIDKSRQYARSRISNIFLRDARDRQVFVSYYDSRTETAHKVSIQRYKDGQLVERIDAPRMSWQDSTWVLRYGYKRAFGSNGEQVEPFEQLEDPHLNFKPQQLRETQVDPDDMSYYELRDFIREVTRNGGNPTRWVVDLNLKLAVPFANFIMVLFGAPLASNKKRSGAIMGVFISLIICFVYYGLMKVTQTMGHDGTLAPLVASWFSNGVFFVSGLFLLVGAQK